MPKLNLFSNMSKFGTGQIQSALSLSLPLLQG